MLHDCVRQTDAPADRAIATAYLAMAALRNGEPERARDLLDEAQKLGADIPLVKRLAQRLEVELNVSPDAIESSD